jgi:bifunctional DNA-binding transcriptional regulator/antitoxin component of YhaV-PrlF toxin-antitoxin module
MPPRGFSEKRQADFHSAPSAPRSVGYTNLKLDSAGRIIVPAEMRAAMLAKPGNTLSARVVDGELRIVSRDWVMHRIDEAAAKFKAANPQYDFQADMDADRLEEARLHEERWARLERDAADLQREADRRR